MHDLILKDLIDCLEDYAPPALADGKDPIGLHFGQADQVIKKILVTLDVRPQVVEEAIEKEVDLILAHHPPIFRPIRSFDWTIAQDRMYASIIKEDLAVYAAHTNLDATAPGINDWLALALDLQQTEIMSVNGQWQGQDYGYGRVGYLPAPLSFQESIDLVKDRFKLDGLRYMGKDFNRSIEKVAIMGGSGASLYTAAVDHGADLYITGDISYHVAHDIEESGLLAIDAGHNIEKICIPYLTDLLQGLAESNQWDLEIFPSKRDTQPFYFA